MNKKEEPKVGLFIDCENVPHKYLSDILNIASDYGELFIRNAYGNWVIEKKEGELCLNMSQWKKLCNQHGIITKSPIYTTKKNSSDIMMAVDILKMLYRGNVLDVIIIVTSDSDFSTIANEIKLNGVRAIGIGVNKITNQQYAMYFNKFYYLDPKGKSKEAPIVDKTKEQKQTVAQVKKQEKEEEPKKLKMSEAQKKQLVSIVNSLIEDSDTRCAYQSLIVDKMKKIYNDFTRKNFGETSYENLIRQVLPKEYKSKFLDDKTTIVWFFDHP